ncbi:hypothetical protein AVEN_89571-1 [Araneus ventricosus]|uniref:Uncharacterized protein n=1 Tax=Araneus ventricosus TaxID=182803 RepID=A0A4Y2GUP2_ARAVE|nr:hypothetical protein AVEN_89571-1 [Araneus ventricosus]
MEYSSVSHRWHTQKDGKSKCEPPMAQAARCDIQVLTTSGTHRPMVHSTASHQWHTPPDGISKCEPPVAHAARWYIQLRVTGGTRWRERIKYNKCKQNASEHL